MLDIEYSVITSDVIKNFDCMNIKKSVEFQLQYYNQMRLSLSLALSRAVFQLQAKLCIHLILVKIDVVKFQTLISCQNGLDKQRKARSRVSLVGYALITNNLLSIERENC